MSAVGPGEVVECVDSHGVESMLEVGKRYIIEEVCDPSVDSCAFDGCHDKGVTVQGGRHVCGNPFCAWNGLMMIFCVHRFRPIYRKEAGAFDHLLKTKEREREDA